MESVTWFSICFQTSIGYICWSLFHWGIIDMKHYISSRCMAQWSNICVYYKMITTVSLVNIHHHTDLYLFLLVIRTFNIDCLSNFQMCSTVLLITVTMLYIAPPWFTYFIIGSFYILTCFTHFVHPPCLCLWQLLKFLVPKNLLCFAPMSLDCLCSTFSIITHFFVLPIMCLCLIA